THKYKPCPSASFLGLLDGGSFGFAFLHLVSFNFIVGIHPLFVGIIPTMIPTFFTVVNEG
ncbi:MAG: hypothetical protein VX803_02580, partial [Pseudomonadota bacterium]|nr:hypothetical protein [Pseudomonadota bacterium]